MTKFSYSEESLKPQSDMFFRELVAAFEDMKGLVSGEVEESVAFLSLPGIIKNHTNITANVFDNPGGPFARTPMLDRNNVIVNAMKRQYNSSHDGIALIRDSSVSPIGGVDIGTGKVYGAFASMPCELALNVEFIGKGRDQMTPEENAGIVLHEVGHLWTYFRYLTNTIRTNQILAGISREFENVHTPEQREAVLVLASQKAGIDLDAKALSKSNDKKVVEYVFISAAIKGNRSDLGSNFYDMSAWESLSDQYATLYKAGRPLATALDKLHKNSFHRAYRSTVVFLGFEALKLVALFILPSLYLTLVAFDGRTDGEYDEPGARFKRIRNQMVENLKDKDASDEDKIRMREDILEIDNILAVVKDKRQLTDALWDYLWPSARRERNLTVLQQDLEGIAANDIFIRASELKQLG